MDTLGVIATVIFVIATAVVTQIGESIRQWLIENVVDPFGQFLIEKLGKPVGQWLTSYMVEPIGQWLGYSFHYSSNIDNMKEQAEKLEEVRERVKHSVDARIGNCGENKADVNRWLENMDVIMGKVKKVLEDETKAKMKCSYGICLNLKLRHELSKKAKKIAKDIDEVLENGGFDKVSNMDYMSFNSRMSTLNGLMVALGDVNINMIGVWGMPGAGKTTLVREVVWQAKKEKLFDEVAMATVMQSPDLRQIQGEIADMLDLKFDDVETVPGRAIRLRDRLKRNNKALVILDDIWNKLDLEAIGIPCNGCKILLTSRDRDILSCEMNTQKKFELDVLSPDEAWSLFEKMAGDSLKDPNLKSIAMQVAEVCACLPLAIVTVATALKNKSLFEWEDALQQLRRPSPVHLTGMQAAIYSKIELSYNHLGSPVVKSFFLLCSQMGPAILYLDLVKYCFGLCLFPGIRTLEEARNKVYTLVRSLKDSCLLLEDPRTSKYVRMHDLVRDVAILIAKAQNVFTVRNDDPVKWPDEDALTMCSSISVRAEDIHELPDGLVCPKLKFLYVHGRDRDFKISETFFRGMRELKVLDLTKMRLSSLPSSINLLTNLRTLCLDQCVLKDIAVIGELKNLDILSLLSSKFTQLPKEIGLLTRLRLLDLSNCTKLEVIPPNVLSRLVQLEELYVCNSFTQWELEGVNNERASLAELKHLSLLTTLEVNIPNVNMLPKNLLFMKLKRYQIFIGDVWDQFGKSESSRALKLKLNSSFELEQGIKMLLSGIEDLCLDELKGVKSIISELDSKGFQQLKHLHVQNNSEMKYIIYSKGLVIADVVFPVLEIFSLKNMINLEEICHGQIPLTSFGNLSIVKVEHCEKLKFIFSSSIAKSLSQLQTLEIRECSIMGAIVEKEEGRIEDRDMKFFPQLRRLLLYCLPKLVSFLSTQNSDIIDAGEVIPQSEQVVFPNLETLELSSIHSEEILIHNQHRASSSFKLTDPRFQNLRKLTVKGSGNLKYLLSSSTATFMIQLKYLDIEDCKVMEESSKDSA
ncbi:disease resistance protein At4g27190-like [Quercus lobata]|uniref:disease resistance protein At4g27190-like n=1 Tax=Quercus lobata TaxID=97700 RepID=UPI0012464A7B|nr:disease resistance protein At4g27190-like [Quercus lobata]